MRRSASRLRVLGTAAVISISGALAATLCAGLAPYFWLGDLAVHFRVQYAVVSLIGVAVLVWARRPVWAAIGLIPLMLNAIAIAPMLRDTLPRDPPQIAASSRFTAVSMNVYYGNEDYAPAIDFLSARRPDIAVLVEVTPEWRRALEALNGLYQYRYFSETPLQRFGEPVERGVLLLSRWPIEHAEELDLGPWTEPGVAATVNIRGQSLHVLGVHPCWPLGWAIAAERNREFGVIAAAARSIGGQLVVLGDFNVTPFSPHFQAMLAQGGLRSAVRGWHPTWPTFLPPAGIQIDHALITPDLQVLRFDRGPTIGSDHRPIIVELARLQP